MLRHFLTIDRGMGFQDRIACCGRLPYKIMNVSWSGNNNNKFIQVWTQHFIQLSIFYWLYSMCVWVTGVMLITHFLTMTGAWVSKTGLACCGSCLTRLWMLALVRSGHNIFSSCPFSIDSIPWRIWVTHYQGVHILLTSIYYVWELQVLCSDISFIFWYRHDFPW